MTGKVIVFIVVIAVILIYTLSNTEPVEVRFLIWHAPISKALITLGSLLLGVILGIVIAKLDQRRRKNRERR